MSIRLLRKFYSCIENKTSSYGIRTNDFTIKYDDKNTNDITIYKTNKSHISGAPSYIFNSSIVRNIILIVTSNRLKSYPFNELRDDLYSHNELELILKYGREITDQKILESINKLVGLDLMLSDIEEFLSKEDFKKI